VVEVTIGPVQPGDTEELIAHLREADRLEVEASVGVDNVESTIHASVASSWQVWTARADGKLGCIFGVVPLSVLGGVGAPWLLGTDVMDANPRVVIRKSPKYIRPMIELFPHLMNVVDVRNKRSIQWLRWLGFRVHDDAPVPYGPYGLPFFLFEMRA
jgi:hypothetical protein